MSAGHSGAVQVTVQEIEALRLDLGIEAARPRVKPRRPPEPCLLAEPARAGSGRSTGRYHGNEMNKKHGKLVENAGRLYIHNLGLDDMHGVVPTVHRHPDCSPSYRAGWRQGTQASAASQARQSSLLRLLSWSWARVAGPEASSSRGSSSLRQGGWPLDEVWR